MKKFQRFKKHVFRFTCFTQKSYGAFNSMRKVVNIGILTSCILTAVPLQYLKAQDQAAKPQKGISEEEHELQEIMVTAAKIETPSHRTPKSLTILTKTQIEQAPVQSLQDLLTYVAQLDIRQKGGHGVQADISIRGGSKDQTAILLNGINISNAHTGGYNLDLPVNLSDIEQIEIIEGPSGLIYGAGAFSGGINIITKKHSDYKAYINAEVGTHRLWGTELRGSGQKGIATGSISFSHNASDGYTNNTDYNLTNIFAQTHLAISNHSLLDINLGYNEKKYGANSFYTAKFPNQYDHVTKYTATAKGQFGDQLKFIPLLYYFKSFDQFELRRGSEDGKNYHQADTYGMNLIAQYKSSWGTSSIGSEVRQEEIRSSVLGHLMNDPHGKYIKSDERTNWSTTLEHVAEIQNVTLSGGILINYNTSESGKYKLLPSIGINYRVIDEVSLFSNWSNSTRMPSFTELWYTTETHSGNSKLKPEFSQSVDLGFKFRNTYFDAYLTGFLMYGRNLIDWVKTEKEPGKFVYASWNQTKVNTQGLETGIRARVGEIFPAIGHKLEIALDYTRLNQNSDTNGQISLFQKNYLRDKVTTQLGYEILPNLSMNWFFRYQHRMGEYEVYENGNSIGYSSYSPFSTLDLRLNYNYRSFQFYVNCNNIYNTRKNDMGNIPQAGFWLISGISCTLK